MLHAMQASQDAAVMLLFPKRQGSKHSKKLNVILSLTEISECVSVHPGNANM